MPMQSVLSIKLVKLLKYAICVSSRGLTFPINLSKFVTLNSTTYLETKMSEGVVLSFYEYMLLTMEEN